MPDTALSTATDAQTNSAKQEIFDYVRTRLGDGMVEVELDPAHYEMAFTSAIDKFRQRSSNSVEESYGFLELRENQTQYTLPAEVIQVTRIYRRTVGGASSSEGGTAFDPFELAYTNVYLLQTGRIGGLATYNMLQGDTNRINQQLDIYRSITKEDIKRVAKTYLNPEQRLELKYLSGTDPNEVENK